MSRVLILTAHPEDQATFFGPTITALSCMNDVTLSSLCLSVGHGDVDGKARARELASSLDVLGIKDERVWVLDCEGLKADINNTWDASFIAESVPPFVLEHNITTDPTFDNFGIFSQPNHRFLYHSTRHLLAHPQTHPMLRAHALLTARSQSDTSATSLPCKLNLAYSSHLCRTRT